MSAPQRFLAIDLGAESGRAILGTVGAGSSRLQMEEVHRFANEPVWLGESLVWDFPRIVLEVERSIARAARATGGRLDGIAVDSWGVDFGLLDRHGGLLGNPVHYRDSRTAGMLERVFAKVPREVIFAETGIQFLELNTLYQLAALQEKNPGILDIAAKFLLVADLVTYLLSGRALSERTLASTTQMWNPLTRAWSQRIAGAIGIPDRIFPEIVEPGTIVAELQAAIARRAGLESAPAVIACGAHDTASAIAAVPATGDDGSEGNWGYLSSGTWSLIGVELDEPRIGPDVLQQNFTNESGVGGKVRFLRNINGLWLVQECRRRWLLEGGEPQELTYEALTAAAAASGPAAGWIRPGAKAFFTPEDMPAAIAAYCRDTGQPVPEGRGAIVRCALESLALTYREALDEAAQLTGRPLKRLHIVGGGCRNELLNQLTADALGLPVIVGPVEATATGNILTQAMAAGALESLAALRACAAAAVDTVKLEPRSAAESTGDWDAKYAAYRQLPE